MTTNDTKSYLLIEFPSYNVPHYAEKLLYDIQLKGITPIIVHPERNKEFIENPVKLYEFVKKGALTQVTAESIAGKLGKNAQKFSMQLIESNLTHFIASDAHNVQTRPFYLLKAMGIVRSEFGVDKPIHKELPTRIKKKKFLGLF